MKRRNETQLLFSVTASDCDWEYYRGSGKGGQKRNKTSSAVRCRHKSSGAVGQADDGRSQRRNRETAFLRMSQTPEFRRWHELEVARRLRPDQPVQHDTVQPPIEQVVEKSAREENLRIEYYDPENV